MRRPRNEARSTDARSCSSNLLTALLWPIYPLTYRGTKHENLHLHATPNKEDFQGKLFFRHTLWVRWDLENSAK
jgi:hypothetical protein